MSFQGFLHGIDALFFLVSSKLKTPSDLTHPKTKLS
jgi:hypothetical protein